MKNIRKKNKSRQGITNIIPKENIDKKKKRNEKKHKTIPKIFFLESIKKFARVDNYIYICPVLYSYGMKNILSNIKDIDSFKGARVPVVLNQAARLKESRKRERGLTSYMECTRREGDFFSLGINFLKSIPRDIAITYIYQLLISSCGFIKYENKVVRAKKFGMSYSACNKMFDRDDSRELFRISDNKTSIVSHSSNSGYSMRFIFINNMNMSSERYDYLVSKSENNSALVRGLKKKRKMEMGQPLCTTTPIDLKYIKRLVASGEYKSLRKYASDIFDMCLYTSSLSRHGALKRDENSVSDGDSIQCKRVKTPGDESLAIERSVGGLEASASRDVIRRRTGISKNRQRKIESLNSGTITKRLDRRKVFTGVCEKCDTFIKEFNASGHIGKCYMVPTKRYTSGGERFYDVYCQAPNFYTFSHLREGQLFFYKIGSEGKRPLARKDSKYDPNFGYRTRLITYSCDDEFEIVCSEEERESMRVSAEQSEFDDYSKGFRPEYMKPDYIVKNLTINDSSIDFARSNRFYFGSVSKHIEDRLSVLDKRKKILESHLGKLKYVKAFKESDPFTKFNDAFASFTNGVIGPKGCEHIFMFSSEGKDVGSKIPYSCLKTTMGNVLSAGGKKDDISLLERVRRRMSVVMRKISGMGSYSGLTFDGQNEYDGLIREFLMLLLAFFNPETYSYMKNYYLEELKKVNRDISVLLLIYESIHGKTESYSLFKELSLSGDIESYTRFKSREVYVHVDTYRDYNFLIFGNNLKRWDLRGGDSLSDSVKDDLPFDFLDLRTMVYTIAGLIANRDSSATAVLMELLSWDEGLGELDYGHSALPDTSDDSKVSRKALRGLIKWFSIIEIPLINETSDSDPFLKENGRLRERWRRSSVVASWLHGKQLWLKESGYKKQPPSLSIL